MPQQINLCTPILLTQKRYFSALAIVQALALFFLVGGGLAAYWVWSLNAASQEFKQTLSEHASELSDLKVAIALAKAGGRPVDPALLAQLQARNEDVGQRTAMLDDLRKGLFKEGWGQSARLQLVAQSIPAQIWVTQLKADDAGLDISGFTLEPAALNEWVRKLSASPLLQGQSLAAVKVDKVDSQPGAKATWSFNLVSALSLTTPSSTHVGGKP